MQWGDLLLVLISILTGVIITYYFTARLRVEIEQLNTILLKTGFTDFGIRLLFEGKEYDRPLVVYDLQVINRGNRDITNSDVIRNITLSVPDGFQIIKVVPSPDNILDIGSIEKVTERNIDFKLESIKKGEKFKFQVFLVFEDFKENKSDFVAPPFSVKGRIKNLTSLRYYDKPPTNRLSVTLLFISFLLAMVFYILTLTYGPFRVAVNSFTGINELDKFISILGALLIMVIPVLVNKLFRWLFP